MINSIKLLCAALALLFTAYNAKAQAVKVDPDMAKFFVGKWGGEGQFANGKSIAADLTFYLSVDSCHLIYVYADRAPNNYKAAGDWSTDRSDKFTAQIINNFTGLKEFNGKWDNGKLMILNTDHYKGNVTIYQSFIYDKIDDDHLKITYMYGRDSTNLKEGDHLIFSRQKVN
jgi:hypothetical protein